MIEIIKHKKSITVYKNIHIQPTTFGEFTKEQLKFIVSCKIYMMYYKIDEIITNIPNTITHIVFLNNKININIQHYLPNSIKHIEFNNIFNSQVDNLPSNLLNLQFGKYFNQPVDNLPMGVKRLQFGEQFNHPANYLPESLENIGFGYKFNQDISNLPVGLKFIQLGNNFSYPIDNLPDSVQIIRFAISNWKCDKNYIISKLPKNIKKIKLPWRFQGIFNATIPVSIEKITTHIIGSYNDKIISNHLVNLGLDISIKEKIEINNIYG